MILQLTAMNLQLTKKSKSILIPGVCFKDNSVVEDDNPHPPIRRSMAV